VNAELIIPSRFNGPARSGNGGFVAGSLAEQAADGPQQTVEVTLRRPPPLETVLTLTRHDGVTHLARDDETIAEARVVDDELDPVDEVPQDVAARAMLRYPGLRHHPFPTCFACGPDRAEGDGLRIFPGPVGESSEDRGHVASLWLPYAEHAESSDLLDGVQRCGTGTTWAALDCVGGWSEDLEGRPSVLGRMTARVDALPVVGEPHVVVGRHLGADGRKAYTASTLYDADGRVVATARHTWIQVDPAAFN
jgi:hypothetical protein